MTNTASKNPFDFSDLSDLPEDIAKRLHTDTNDSAAVYAEVIRKGAEAGHAELDINQIMAAAMRMGIDVPTQQTVRNYLNKAVELKMVTKPTRQTYGLGTVQVATGAVEVPEEATEEPKAKGKTKAEAVVGDDATVTADVTPDADPLAGL